MLNSKLFLSTAVALSLLSCDYSHAVFGNLWNTAKNKVSNVASNEIETEVLKNMDKKYGIHLTEIAKNQKGISSAKKAWEEAKKGKDDQALQSAVDTLSVAALTEYRRALTEYNNIRKLLGKATIDDLTAKAETNQTNAEK